MKVVSVNIVLQRRDKRSSHLALHNDADVFPHHVDI